MGKYVEVDEKKRRKERRNKVPKHRAKEINRNMRVRGRRQKKSQAMIL